jgi:hypothetical protein
MSLANMPDLHHRDRRLQFVTNARQRAPGRRRKMSKSITGIGAGLQEKTDAVFDGHRPTLGAMEGNGAYNRGAKIQGAGVAAVLPLLEEAVENITLIGADAPIVIADYGSSEGENSLAPIGLAIRIFRRRVTPHRPIVVYHVDLPINDFNSLFRVLSCNPRGYWQNEPNVFSAAVGRSFYETVLPPDSVDFGWSSFAALWLSRIPALIPEHFLPLRASGAIRETFQRQAAADWEEFLRLRSVELRPSGRMMLVLPGQDADGLVGLEPLFDIANDVLAEMVRRGNLTSAEREQMVIASYPRSQAELMAPFHPDAQFHSLTVEAYHETSLPDAAWLEFEKHQDLKSLALERTRFFRSAFAPTLGLALLPGRDRQAFAAALGDSLTRRLADWPEPLHMTVQCLVLSKRC